MTNPPAMVVDVSGNYTDEEIPVALNLVAVAPTTLPAHSTSQNFPLAPMCW